MSTQSPFSSRVTRGRAFWHTHVCGMCGFALGGPCRDNPRCGPYIEETDGARVVVEAFGCRRCGRADRPPILGGPELAP